MIRKGELRVTGANIILKTQADMLVYHAPYELSQLDFPQS